MNTKENHLATDAPPSNQNSIWLRGRQSLMDNGHSALEKQQEFLKYMIGRRHAFVSSGKISSLGEDHLMLTCWTMVISVLTALQAEQNRRP